MGLISSLCVIFSVPSLSIPIVVALLDALLVFGMWQLEVVVSC